MFKNESDALKVANAVRANRAGRYPGWASQRTFGLDEEACKTIAAALKDR